MSGKRDLTPQDQTGKTKDDGPRTMLYECCVCHNIKQPVEGQKVSFYVKETIGHGSPGPICPECELKVK